MNYDKLVNFKALWDIEPVAGNRACHYQIFDKKNKLYKTFLNEACHSSIRGYADPEESRIVRMYVPVQAAYYSEKDIKRWLKFCKSCSFPSVFEGTKQVKIETKSVYGDDKLFDSKCYVVRIDTKHYLNDVHVFAAVTLIRKFYYNYSHGFVDVPQYCFEIKKVLGDKIDNLAVTQLAAVLAGVSETVHSFTAYDKNYNRKYHLPTVEKFLNSIKDCGIWMSPHLCCGEKFNKIDFLAKWKDGKYDELFK